MGHDIPVISCIAFRTLVSGVTTSEILVLSNPCSSIRAAEVDS
ncbi:hypothetical protein Hanom_Chr08g00752161 [Helianthus anomalus]